MHSLSLSGRSLAEQIVRPGALALLVLALVAFVSPAHAQDPATATAPASGADQATTEAEMKPYTQAISGTQVSFDLVPIAGGTVLLGSPDTEPGRKSDEGPQHEVKIEPFWMGQHEVTWDLYDIFSYKLDIQRRQVTRDEPTPLDAIADLVTRPTKPYTDMTFGMGKEGYPAICMTQLAARAFCKWLSAKTGHFYRLPTEAEWEYACRAGTTTAYSFGDDAAALDEYAWYFDNSDGGYHPVGKKKPNPWGLYDMHGNVNEWCLDQYAADTYARRAAGELTEPWVAPTGHYTQVVRGGSWDDDPEALRSAARRGSEKSWKQQDPQIPQSVWYHTDALWLGFRVIRPLVEPSDEAKALDWGDALVPKEQRQ